MFKHDPDASLCPECEKMLKTAHPYMQEWFHKMKAMYPLIHVSCAYRGPKEQEQAYISGASRATYPKSKHNATDKDGKPCSLALDLFLIDADGVARWPWKFYNLMNEECKEQKLPIRWGGTFTDIKDGPHFEMVQAADV